MTWHAKGQALLAEGKAAEGVAALRKAVAADRGSVDYALALVRALRGVNEDEEAWQILLRLRQQEPENSEINYRLGRLAGQRGEPDLAIRYYNHALYGIEPVDASIDRRQIQTELATLLLDQGDTDSAAGLLSQIARELPDEPEARMNLARLYQRAGEHRQALVQFNDALADAPEMTEAMVGASESAFAVGDFVTADVRLAAAINAGVADADGSLASRLGLIRLVVSNNPLAVRVAMTERVRRLTAGLQWAEGRMTGCGESAAPPPSGLAADLQAFRRQPRQDLRDTDVLASGVDLIARIEADARTRCATTDPAGEAWVVIQRSRSVTE
jgi:tetratricopeptide (TPR) repeat protein